MQADIQPVLGDPSFKQALIRQVARYVGGEAEETRMNVFQDPEIKTAWQLFQVKGVFERLL